MAGRRPSPPSLHRLQPRPLPPRYFPHRDGLCSRGCPSPLHAPLGCQNQPPAIKGALSLRHIIVDLIPPQSRTVSCRHPHARVSSFHYMSRGPETCSQPFLAFVLSLSFPGPLATLKDRESGAGDRRDSRLDCQSLRCDGKRSPPLTCVLFFFDRIDMRSRNRNNWSDRQ